MASPDQGGRPAANAGLSREPRKERDVAILLDPWGTRHFVAAASAAEGRHLSSALEEGIMFVNRLRTSEEFLQVKRKTQSPQEARAVIPRRVRCLIQSVSMMEIAKFTQQGVHFSQNACIYRESSTRVRRRALSALQPKLPVIATGLNLSSAWVVVSLGASNQ